MRQVLLTKGRLRIRKRLSVEMEQIKKSKPQRNTWCPKLAGIHLWDYFTEKIQHQAWAKQQRAQRKSLGDKTTPTQKEAAEEAKVPLQTFKNLVAAVLFNAQRLIKEFPWSKEDFQIFAQEFKMDRALRPPKGWTPPKDDGGNEIQDPKLHPGEHKFGRHKVLMSADFDLSTPVSNRSAPWKKVLQAPLENDGR